MPDEYRYPKRSVIINVNKSVNLMSTRKADAFKLLRSGEFIDSIIDMMRKEEGDAYDKAAVLLRRLIVAHGFASGNKRTAIMATAFFIEDNSGRIKLDNAELIEKVLRNIRLYNEKEISNWLRKGEIDESRTKR